MTNIYKLLLITIISLTQLNGFEITLSPGEEYILKNQVVKCVAQVPTKIESKNSNGYSSIDINNYYQKKEKEKLIIDKECQYYDKREETCLFEKTIYKKGDITCETKCQHWDPFFDKCLYVATCDYSERNQILTQEHCITWNDRDEKCTQKKSRKQEI